MIMIKNLPVVLLVVLVLLIAFGVFWYLDSKAYDAEIQRDFDRETGKLSGKELIKKGE